jgi:hypothetical protein
LLVHLIAVKRPVQVEFSSGMTVTLYFGTIGQIALEAKSTGLFHFTPLLKVIEKSVVGFGDFLNIASLAAFFCLDRLMAACY